MANLIGKSLGRYHILEQLGEGGMAVVYKAFDTRLEAEVAVKVIRTDNILPNVLERALKRFEREAKAVARLNHLNIVNITDYGEFEGQPYLVMPYLQGGTLKEMLAGKPIDWQIASQLLIPIAKALGYAHRQEMIHRDVKPANILITEDGEPMLTDFGVAKIIDNEVTVDLTGTSMAVGTPDYMAPEQFQGKTDARSDIYGLGIVLYEMVTGRKPYVADTPAALIIKQATDPLPRPSQFAPKIPGNVEHILLKALAKNPANRYQSMGELVAALESAAIGKTLQGTSKKKSKLSARGKSGKEKEPNSKASQAIPKWVGWAVFGIIGLGMVGGLNSWISSRKPVDLIPSPISTLTKNALSNLAHTPVASITHPATHTPVSTPISTPTDLSHMQLPIVGNWGGITTGTNGDNSLSERIATVSIPSDCKLGFSCGQFSTAGACNYEMTLIDVQGNIYTFESLSVSGEDFCLGSTKTSVKLTLVSESVLDFYYEGGDVIRKGNLELNPPTDTPDLTKTIEPKTISELIPGAEILYHTEFDDMIDFSRNWISYGNIDHVSGVLVLSGKNAGAKHKSALKTGNGILVLFKYSSETNKNIVLINSLGIMNKYIGINPLGITLSSDGEWLGGQQLNGNLSLEANHWYYGMIEIKTGGEFYIKVWDKDNPNLYNEKSLPMGETWNNQNWYGGITTNQYNSGSIEIDMYQEYLILE